MFEMGEGSVILLNHVSQINKHKKVYFLSSDVLVSFQKLLFIYQLKHIQIFKKYNKYKVNIKTY